jgi:TRAP-type C4-dicarboxylate transport system permease small subunit
VKLRALDHVLKAITAAASVLVLPISLLLFLQWPLREWLQQYSREANDLAQIMFALYVSVAITFATRRRAHLASDVVAVRFSPALRRRFERASALLILLPWSLFLIYIASPTVWQSLLQREAFPETFNPGYFIIRLALWLLAVLVCLQAIVNTLTAHDSHSA